MRTNPFASGSRTQQRASGTARLRQEKREGFSEGFSDDRALTPLYDRKANRKIDITFGQPRRAQLDMSLPAAWREIFYGAAL